MSRTGQQQGRIVVVIPCFNESRRLDTARTLELLSQPGIEIVFVDDASTDGTLPILRAAAERNPARARVVALDRNVGKGEAVRTAMADALRDGASIVAFLDADLAAPPSEMLRIIGVLLADSSKQVALGSRVRLLGKDIKRGLPRHYLGRVFATAASMTLRAPVYDTQCGAKAFRASPALTAALREPFQSRWVFDVELMSRLLREGGVPLSAFVEVPLEHWHHVEGSKVTPVAAAKAGFELLAIAWRSRR